MAELGGGEEKARVRETSREVIARTLQEYVVPVIGDPNREMRVLSVGCGLALELGPINDIFPRARYTGMDVDDLTLQAAKKMNADLPSIANTAFVVGDASRRDGFPGSNYDLVLIRNPQMKGTNADPHRSEALWQQIVRNTTEVVTKGGVLYIPTHDDEEQDLVRQGLSQAHLVMLKMGRNPYANPQLPFDEGNIIVAKKL